MDYFKYLPKVNYPAIEGETDLMTNLTVRGKIIELVRKNSAIYYPWIVSDGERADVIAHKYYGNSNYVWLVYYANDIIDPIHDWVMDSEAFEQYIIGKYGDLASPQLATHHYLDTDGNITSEPTVDEVSVYEYEFSLNEKKREIQLIDAGYLSQIVNELKRLFK